jgi:hypothetical protein
MKFDPDRGRGAAAQQLVGKEQTFLDFPPMRRGASFNPDAVGAEEAKRTEQPQAQQRVPAIDRALK